MPSTPSDPRSPPPSASVTPQHAAVFELCLQEAATAGRALMEALLADARQLATLRGAEQRDPQRAESLEQAASQLNRHAASLCEQYPAALRRAFSDAANSFAEARTPLLSDLRFDQLELMDDGQVLEKMELARAQQSATLEVEAALTELNGLVSTVQGFRNVQPERNPFRPASYLAALREVFAQTGASAGVRLEWMQLTSGALGRLLRGAYGQLSTLLKHAGVDPAAYQVTQTASGAPPGGGGGGRGGAGGGGGNGAPSPLLQREETLLTVKQLRRLVAGELGGDSSFAGDGGEAEGPPLAPEGADAPGAAGDAAPRYYRRATDRRPGSNLRRRASDQPPLTAEDEAALRPSNFEHTVPAALEALQEMQQVEQAMARLADRGGPLRRRPVPDSRRAGDPPAPPSTDLGPTQLARLESTELYDRLRQQAQGVGQVLGLEVVTLMVENIAKDARVLPPVQEVVRSLESPLLRLAMVDPRFFSDKRHPARRMLEAIVEQSARFEAADSPAFMQFIQPLRQVVNELLRVPVEGPEPFAQSLETLGQQWESQMEQERQQREQVVQALRQAEQRNLLAIQIAQDIRDRSDAAFVPAPVFVFATGPWAQVIAHARLVAGAGPAPELGSGPPPPTAEQCTALVSDLFWSVNLEQTRSDPKRLVRLIPGLLSRLRGGLRSIDYPQASLNAFFEELMALHQKGLASGRPAPAATPATKAVRPSAATAEPLVPADFLSGVMSAKSSAGLKPASMAKPAGAGKASAPASAPAHQAPPPDPDQVWLAPNEAQASGFLGDFEFSDFPSAPTAPAAFAAGVASARAPLEALEVLPPDANAAAIPLGSWVDLTTDSSHMRAELVWVSPEGTMFMFTTATGRNQSMTRKSLDKLIQLGRVKVVQRQKVLDSALDAVAQAALQNSVGQAKP